jgi:hypothetical protein
LITPSSTSCSEAAAHYAILNQMNSPRPRTTLEAAIKPALRLMRDYICDGRQHIPLSAWDLKVARRLLRVRTNKYGWLGNKSWQSFMREIGRDPESLEVVDEFRWAVAKEMIFSGEFPKTFPYSVFRERLALAREAALNADCVHNTTESVDESEPSSRRQALEGFGLELD